MPSAYLGGWFYMEPQDGVKGYAYAPYFSWGGELTTLPIIQPTGSTTPKPPSGSGLRITPGPLDIDHIWPASVCHRGGGWTARFEVKIKGGDGRNYRLFWNEEHVPYTVKESERDVAIVTRTGAEGLMVGRISVESGGDRVSGPASDRKPDPCRYD